MPYKNMFTDDAKIMRKVANEEDCVALNQDLDRISKWSRKWEMTWNGLDEETVCAKMIHEYKANLDKKRYGDGTARA